MPSRYPIPASRKSFKPVVQATLLACLAIIPAMAESVEILRDEYGTPHIFAETLEGAAFGAGFAQAEDRLAALLENLSRDAGSIPAPEEMLSEPVRAMVEAFAGGVNLYLTQHPDTAPQPRVSARQVVEFSRIAHGWIQGSGDLILGPDRTQSGAVVAILDPWANWNSSDRPYEMHLIAASGGDAGISIEVTGFAPVGVPFPLVGHSGTAALGWSRGNELAGVAALDQAWNLIVARNLEEAESALAMAQIPGSAFVGTRTGQMVDGYGTTPAFGYLMRPRPSPQADGMVRWIVGRQNHWPAGLAHEIAFATDVYHAEEWQTRIAKAAPDLEFGRQLSGWNRRADAASADALAFYLFKLEMEGDAALPEPPDSLSDARIRAAVRRANDRFELDMDYGATFGTLFRTLRQGARESHPMGGGTVSEAAMVTPRAMRFIDRGRVKLGSVGQTSTLIVDLGNAESGDPVRSWSVLAPGISDNPQSPHFDDQSDMFGRGETKPTYFGDRKELERHVESRTELSF